MPNLPFKYWNYRLPRALVRISAGWCWDFTCPKERRPDGQNDSQSQRVWSSHEKRDFWRYVMQLGRRRRASWADDEKSQGQQEKYEPK